MSNDQFIIKFDYNKEFLQEIVKEVETLDISDLDLVKETHKKFVKIRTTIKKQEKEMVDGANEYRKKVFDLRNEYLEITEPVEEKLKSILDAEEERLILETRKKLLPIKKQQLSVLKISIQPTDEEILALDDIAWLDFYNLKFCENNKNIEEENRKEQEKKDKEENEKKHTQELKDIEKKTREEEIEKAAQKEKDRIEKEKEDKAATEAREIEEKAKLEADNAYKTWLNDNGCNSQTKDQFVIQKLDDGSIRLSKIVGIYKTN